MPRPVLEVDEAYLPASLVDLRPAAVVLLNLSRSARSDERGPDVAGRWRAVLRDAKGIEVVANADDPLVVFGAGGLPSTRWVSAGGLGWRNDATGCPACLGRITFDEITSRRSPSSDGTSGRPPGPRGAWRCSSCGFARPRAHVGKKTTLVRAIPNKLPSGKTVGGFRCTSGYLVGSTSPTRS